MRAILFRLMLSPYVPSEIRRRITRAGIRGNRLAMWLLNWSVVKEIY